MRLAGKAALIAGGAGAMGSAQARLFSREGAAVAVADFRLDKAEEVASQLRTGGSHAIAIDLDVGSEEQWRAAIARTEREFGKLNILAYSAGANYRVSFDDQTKEMWDTIIVSNLTGPFLGIKAVVPAMRRAGGGSIILVGSIASVRPGGGSPGYGASKVGVVGLMRSAARSYAAEGIRCNVVAPGHVDTPFLRANNSYSPNDWSTSIDNPENYQGRLRGTPIGRLMTPEDIAWAYVYLASDEAAAVTGVTLPVDGGALL